MILTSVSSQTVIIVKFLCECARTQKKQALGVLYTESKGDFKTAWQKSWCCTTFVLFFCCRTKTCHLIVYSKLCCLSGDSLMISHKIEKKKINANLNAFRIVTSTTFFLKSKSTMNIDLMLTNIITSKEIRAH